MRIRSLLALLAACFLSFSRVEAQGKQVTLVGLIVDSASGQPLDKVAVYIPDDAQTDTNRDGMFKLKFVPGESSSLILFRRIGYSPRALRMNLQGREGREIELGKIIMKKAA